MRRFRAAAFSWSTPLRDSSFSRARAIFHVNAAGQLVTATGQFVQGWNAASGTLSTNGATSDIVLPTTASNCSRRPPDVHGQRESERECHGGLGGRTFSSPIQVYDAQGVAHTLTVTYTETAAEHLVVFGHDPVDGSDGGQAPTTTQLPPEP
jgi:hypothetical protein